ncbi:hypothetical protein CLV45_2205 [Hymenobacter chitinivorans DSM 11115]|uniref:MG2 domain-containing protein n=2 Tax=Hymenobacter chitinivorans TaxID=89969 RepID=A0A2M9BS99_9BACT|nr:hypothetical protein CLV45_2205 [Hymenobacter chitinivorans DSM 11115]
MSLGSAYAQSDSLRTLDRQLSRYSQQRLPEKLFLHVDRPFYVSGEIMWFKVYAVDGVLHKPLTTSKVAYVELLDKEQKPVLQGKIALQNAAGQGTFVLPKSLASGTYTVRAYTNWMKNFPPEYYFHSTITVVNTFGSVTKATPDQTATGIDAQFFPEGGHLVKGLTSTVAFKINDQHNQGVAASGIIVDQRGQNVAQFSTLKFGLGSFSFTPTEAGATYSAIIQLPNRQTLTRKLPAVQEQGYVLHLAPTADGLTITVQTPTPAEAADDILLLGHARQQPFVAVMGRFRDNKAVFTINKKDLPEGIAHFTVFNAARKPLCERLYFTPPAQQLAIQASINKQEYAPREKVSLQLATAGPGAQPLAASASVAVYRLDSLSTASGASINSYLWLASDLKGHLENPDYYFSANSPEVAQAADNLMLTQGWSRFRWDEVQTAPRPAPTFYPETSGHWIQGKLTHRGTGQAAPGIPVYLASPSRQPRLYSSISQPDGRLQFDLRDYYGPKEIVVQTNTQVDSTYQVEIYSPFSTAFAPTRHTALQLPESLRPELAQRHLQAQVQTAYFKKFTNQYTLPQTDSLPFYGKPDERYLLDAYTRFKVMEEVMREYVPGVLVRIRKGQFHFQVIDHLNNVPMTDDPLVVLDGVPIFNTNKVIALDPLKIQKLDVITSRYFHGRQIHQGLVSYSTYKGDLGSYKLDAHALLQEYEGLQLQREFYAPRYDTPQAQQSRLPDFRNLLYWNPQVTTSAAATDLTFYTADLPGRYVVVVQGMAANGLAGSHRIFLQVKSAL